MRRSLGRLVLTAGIVAIGQFVAVAEAAPSLAAGTPGVVYLERTPGWKVQGDQGLLVRELVRQSLLIAARDELGLLTRDFWLGETMPATGANAPLDLIAHPGKPDRIELCRLTGSIKRKVDEWEFNSADPKLYKELSQNLETLSRTKFVELLKKAGFHGSPNLWKPETPLADEAQRLLGEMTFSSQFLAVRQIHAAIRGQGESPALLAGLVRGYANLGVLTECYWHPSHKAFKARALLYAQRLTARRVRPLWATYHRAYIDALLGLHALASKELEDAEKQFRAAPASNITERPTWAESLGAFCRYRMDQIDAANIDAADMQLFLLLEYLNAETAGSSNVAVETAIRVLEKMPECYRVHDGFCHFAGVGSGHSATVSGMLLVDQKLYPRLENMADLPSGVRRAMQVRADAGGLLQDLFGPRRSDPREKFKVRARVIAALLAAGSVEAAPPAKLDTAAERAENAANEAADPDRAEFSWSILGHLLRELSFVQVWRRAHFEHHMLSVDSAGFLAASAPLVQTHPYRVALATMTKDVAARQKAIEQLNRLEPDSLELTAEQMWDELWPYNPDRRNQWFAQAHSHMDNTLRDRDLEYNAFYNNRPHYAWTLLRLSRHNPRAQAELIHERWQDVRKQAAEWEKDNQPAVLRALGDHYIKEERWDDAERCLWGAIKRSPDRENYEILARAFEKQGNGEKWLSTLEGFLQQPDYGLSHAQVQDRIARHFAERGQWEKALPYARSAADSYAGWALQLAGCCEEVAQDWDEAERYFKAESNRYTGSELEWYLFCKRTGQGDLSAATQLARHFAERPHEKDDGSTLAQISSFYLLEHDLKKALAGYEKLSAANFNPFNGLHAALIADELKDVKTRDAALLRVKTQGPHYQSHRTKKPHWGMIALAELIAEDLAAGGKGKIDPAAIEKLHADGDALDGLCIDSFLATYLDLHGRSGDAIRLWKRGVACTATDHSITVHDLMRTLCGAGLLRHGIKPADYKDLLSKAPEPKKNDGKAPGERAPQNGLAPAQTDARKSKGSGEAHVP